VVAEAVTVDQPGTCAKLLQNISFSGVIFSDILPRNFGYFLIVLGIFLKFKIFQIKVTSVSENKFSYFHGKVT